MKTKSAGWSASVVLVLSAVVAGPPANGQPTPEVVVWGSRTNVPASVSNVVALAGWGTSLAVLADGRVVQWDDAGAKVLGGFSNVVAVAGGCCPSPTMALTADGRVLDEAGNSYWDDSSVTSNVVALAVGPSYMALLAGGRVVQVWGGESVGPAGLSNVVAIAAGYEHALALTAGGRVVALGYVNRAGQASVPAGLRNVTAIAAGNFHSLALTTDGQVVAWGDNRWGQTDVPRGLSNVVAIAAGSSHSLALTTDGLVVAWGDNRWGQTAVPPGLSNVVAITAGSDHNVALRGSPPGVTAPAHIGPRFLIGTAGQPFHHRILVKNGATGYAATGLPPGLTLDSSTGIITGRPGTAGRHEVWVLASNRLGADAWPVTLFVNEPAAPVSRNPGVVMAGLACEFMYDVPVYNAPDWYAASGLPAGVVLDERSGLIFGVPTEAGDYEVSLTAGNPQGVATATMTLRVSPVVEWGAEGMREVPAGLSNVVAIARGAFSHRLALTAEGRVVSWKNADWEEPFELPAGLSNVVAISGDYQGFSALRADGRVLAWGTDGIREWDSKVDVSSSLWPESSTRSDVVAVVRSNHPNSDPHQLDLTAAGQVLGSGNGWGPGEEWGGQATVPSSVSNAVAIAAGYWHSLALLSDGQVVAWGDSSLGQTDVPPGLRHVVAVAAGPAHSLAVRADGGVVAWGTSVYWQPAAGLIPSSTAMVPQGLKNVVSVVVGAGYLWGGGHSLALLRQPAVPEPRLELERGTFGLELKAHGASGISCTLLRATDITGPWLPTQPVTFTNTVQRLRAVEPAEHAQFFKLLRK